MNGQKKRTVFSVLGLVALLLACMVGVQGVFAGLGMVAAQGEGSEVSQSASADASQSQPEGEREPSGSGETDAAQPAPRFCPFCGEGLPSTFQWGQYCPYCGEQVNS